MEGLAGVALREQISRHLGANQYQDGRRLLMAEVNSVVQGAFDGGATDVLVHDNHGSSMNMIVDQLDPRVHVYMGNLPYPRYAIVEPDVDVYFCLGYHAAQGTLHAFRDHTVSSSRWSDVWLNGLQIGELGLSAACAGVYGVPVGLVGGDDKLCAEARALLGTDVELVQVKTGLGRHAAKLLPVAGQHAKLRSAAARAVRQAHALAPWTLDPPYELRLQYMSPEIPDSRAYDGVHCERLDGTTICLRGDSLIELAGQM
jgi:D-amino peptidase